MESEIIRMNHQGEGIALINNIITFVPKTIVGDIVLIKIIETKKNYQKGKVLKFIKESPIRQKAFCPYYNLCGGCSLQNLTYKETLNFKKDNVLNILKTINVNPKLEIVENPNDKNYRQKISLKVVDGKIGFYEKDSNSLVEISFCPITSSSLNKIIPLLEKINLINGEVTLRCNQKGEVLVIIDTIDNLNIDILEKEKTIIGIVLNKKCIYGKDYLVENINDIKYKITFDAFFQVNPYVAKILFEKVKENITRNDEVLDLYSGVGTLALSSGQIAKKVLGVEIIPNAVTNATSNANLNNLSNVEFIVGDVLKVIKTIKDNYNVLIVDPPRKGLDKNTITFIQEKLPPKIIYVSCNIHTLTRDLSFILPNYEIKKFYLLDMFSYTFHIECLCILNLR